MNVTKWCKLTKYLLWFNYQQILWDLKSSKCCLSSCLSSTSSAWLGAWSSATSIIMFRLWSKSFGAELCRRGCGGFDGRVSENVSCTKSRRWFSAYWHICRLFKQNTQFQVVFLFIAHSEPTNDDSGCSHCKDQQYAQCPSFLEVRVYEARCMFSEFSTRSVSCYLFCLS